ncbi:hypothetical protein [Cognatishimia sp.]|uniref:hypothetical protein n=1 Tax=Cognatishimia sp. TaxID=2211648 RepID=UPI0035117B78|nr:hypothetical protein [Cognatishimia sp.]NQY58536.1 hypothetical protein [Cognatishimia sp.]
MLIDDLKPLNINLYEMWHNLFEYKTTEVVYSCSDKLSPPSIDIKMGNPYHYKDSMRVNIEPFINCVKGSNLGALSILPIILHHSSIIKSYIYSDFRDYFENQKGYLSSKIFRDKIIKISQGVNYQRDLLDKIVKHLDRGVVSDCIEKLLFSLNPNDIRVAFNPTGDSLEACLSLPSGVIVTLTNVGFLDTTYSYYNTKLRNPPEQEVVKWLRVHIEEFLLRLTSNSFTYELDLICSIKK